MEKIIALPEEAEEARTRLPIVPIAFGSGSKCPSADEAHLLLSVRAGSLSYTDLSGEETADEGQLLFVRRGHTLPDLAPSADFDCEFVLFDAAEDFLAHLDLDDISAGEVGEGCGRLRARILPRLPQDLRGGLRCACQDRARSHDRQAGAL